MADIAIDIDSGKKIHASIDVERKNYKCCNEKCTAILRIRKGESPCFFALETSPHIQGCNYAQSSNHYKYSISPDFSIINFIKELEMKPLSSNKEKNCKLLKDNFNYPPKEDKRLLVRTVKQFYDYCKQNSDAYQKYCIDEDYDPIQLMMLGRFGVNYPKVFKGYISCYNKDCLIVKIQSNKVDSLRYMCIKVNIDNSIRDTLFNKIVKRALKVVKSEIIICCACLEEFSDTLIKHTGQKVKTRTTVYINNLSQVHIPLQLETDEE